VGTASLPFSGRTYVFLSDDNGTTWSKRAFPESTVTGTPFGDFDGVALNRLFVTSDKRLLAYGTIKESNLFVTWSIGGLIYRSNDGVSWNRSTFELGPLMQLADSSTGRMVGGGFTSVIDSADGAVWNGYLIRDANISLSGGAMSTATKKRLFLEDIIFHGGTYIAQAATYVPYDPGGAIFSANTDQLFNLSSSAPFGASRAWTGTELTTRYGKLVSDGTTLARVGQQGAFTSGNSGASWNQVNSNAVATERAITRTSSGTFFAIGSASGGGDAVWSSANLSSWTNVYSRPDVADIYYYPLGANGSTLFTCGSNGSSINVLYASADNGDTWNVRQAGLPGCSGKLIKRGNRLLFPAGLGAMYSDDNGLSWQVRQIVPSGGNSGRALTVTSSGRLIFCPTQSFGPFAYVSDDGGDTWSARSGPSQFGDYVFDIAAVNGARVIAFSQNFGAFSPRLIISDDSGDTWREDLQLQSLAGLASSGGSRLIQLQQITRGANGRLFIRGGSEVLTSEDNGTTWVYRFGTYFSNGSRAGEWWGTLYDMRYLNGRWLMPMEQSSNDVRNGKFNWLLISDDDGNSWYRKEIPSKFALVRSMLAGANQRAVIFGTRGAVWLSDPANLSTPPKPRMFARAGDVAHIEVPRPPISGAVQMRYSAVQDRSADAGSVATAGTDYTTTAGILSWAAGDNAAKFVDVPTLNTGVVAANKDFALQLIPDNIDLASSATILVTILNISQVQAAGLETLQTENLVLNAGGSSQTFRVVLRRAPAANVSITLSAAGASAATFAPGTLTFTPANWQTPQIVTVTPDATRAINAIALGSSYRITLTLSSTDTLYQNLPVYSVYYRFPTDLLMKDGFE
jgi:hypothetical protein